jgi:hypothetical protein
VRQQKIAPTNIAEDDAQDREREESETNERTAAGDTYQLRKNNCSWSFKVAHSSVLPPRNL